MKKQTWFLKEGLKNLKTVGTITRSSSFVCKRMARQVDWSEPVTVVELGAGDGVITRHLLETMSKDSRLLAFEILPSMVEKLAAIQDDRLEIIAGDVEQLSRHLADRGIQQVDYIFSAIPFVNVPRPTSLRILEQCRAYLKTGGKYVQIHYSLLTRKLYQEIFGNVQVKFELLNLPPAFILVSEKVP